MTQKFCEFVQYLFKLGCFIVVVYMISVWFKKYLKDEDLCLVDYTNFGNTTDIEHPELSLCFLHPFIDQNLEKRGVNSNKYLNHLRADPFIENFPNIDYTNVTFNLEEYYVSTGIAYENGSDSSIDTGIHQTFNGFWYDQFMKCFSVDSKKLNTPDVKYVIQLFDN